MSINFKMFNRSLTKIVLYFAGFAIAAGPGIGHAQVLTPPEQVETKAPVKVQFSGIVSQQKKYSFAVKADDRDYQVKWNPGATLTLRLNKPAYDFPNRTVKVVRVVSSSDEKTGNASATEPGRISYKLPKTLFVEAKFEHVRQMQRIMQAKVKRINNYALSAEDPGAEMPSETSLRIRGQLLPSDEAGIAKLKVNTEEFPVMLGHRGATMSGFNILDLEPDTTEVFVWGVLAEDAVVSADRIEFRPIVGEPKK